MKIDICYDTNRRKDKRQSLIDNTSADDQFYVRYTWLNHEDINWVNDYYDQGNKLKTNVRAMTKGLAPFWKEFEQFIVRSWNSDILIARYKIRNFDENTIDHINIFRSKKHLDGFRKEFQFETYDIDQIFFELEKYGFEISRGEIFIDKKEFARLNDLTERRFQLGHDCHISSILKEKNKWMVYGS
jgi:hypothetical protein